MRQGCILSPLLFNLFLSDLAKKYESTANQFQLGEVNFNALFWADDLVLFAKSKEDLDSLLKILETYCKDNEIIINTKKTKCMIFNKTGRLMRRPFYLNGVQLENVRSYKYLGFVITPSGEILTGLQDLRDRAFKAYMKIKNEMGTSFNQHIVTTLTLIDALVRPILLYAGDFWGCLKLPRNNPIENLHMLMCKQLLGVQKQTSNIGVLLELGRIPMCLYTLKSSIKNWERIKRGQGNEILLESCKDSVDNQSWIPNIRWHLEENEMIDFYETFSENPYPFVHKIIFNKLRAKFHIKAFDEIKDNSSKLRTYALFKTKVGLEPYLTEINNVQDRIFVTKFRLSNHRLMIEVGRYNNTPREHRFCPFCPNTVEDECHFMFRCKPYTYLRTRYLGPLMNSNPGFQYQPHDRRLQILLANVNYNTAKYIYCWQHGPSKFFSIQAKGYPLSL